MQSAFSRSEIGSGFDASLVASWLRSSDVNTLKDSALTQSSILGLDVGLGFDDRLLNVALRRLDISSLLELGNVQKEGLVSKSATDVGALFDNDVLALALLKSVESGQSLETSQREEVISKVVLLAKAIKLWYFARRAKLGNQVLEFDEGDL